SSGSQFSSAYVVDWLSGASVLCTCSARVYCTGTAPSEGGEQTEPKQRWRALDQAQNQASNRRLLVRNSMPLTAWSDCDIQMRLRDVDSHEHCLGHQVDYAAACSIRAVLSN